ncbi:MAG: hypothetical protein H6513_06330 [Acidimicrobiaceae bacterium]|nr:hypothetical protein [Acidimicrobiaceae bacterium]
MADDRDALEQFTAPDFDGERTVVLAAADMGTLAGELGDLQDLPYATVSDASREPNGYRFTVTADAPTLVVVPVNWADGWSATTGDHDLRILRGNYEQLVLVVPAGTTRIDLRYRSPGFVAGAAVSGAAIAVAVLVPVVGGRRRRRAAPEPEGSEG